VLVCFALVFTLLEAAAFTRLSATWDEPIHLTAGYFALAHADHRVDPSHPPFLRMWAALPLLVMGPAGADTTVIDRTPVNTWFSEAYTFAHRFLYRLNDADRLLFAARSMIVFWGIALGLLLFFWAYEWLGLLPAIVALALYSMEPNLSAHASLVTTDLGVTCFVFGTAYFLWRTCRRFTAANLAGLAASVALASVSKFSAVLLAPIVVLLLAIAVGTSGMKARRAAAILALLAVTTYVAIWAVYGFRYAPSASDGWLVRIQDTAFASRSPGLTQVLAWIDSHHLLPNAFTQGFLFSQLPLARWPAFLFGHISAGGWWYYFPAALLLKTPLALLVLVLFGAGLLLWRRPRLLGSSVVFVAVPALAYLGVAMASGVNMGVRHILPIYPFMLLLAAVAARELLDSRRRVARTTLAILMVLSAAEVARAHLRPLTFFNTVAGGPANGFRHLADSNLAWGSNLKALKGWMEEKGIAHVNLAYFGTADPAYYGIDCTYLPGSPSFALDLIAKPRLPGYVAISGTVLSGVYLEPRWRLFYSAFWTLEPAAVIGNSMRVYWVDRWPEDGASTEWADQHLPLADALLLGMQWSEHAAVHYQAHLDRHSDDAAVLNRLGVALAESGRFRESIEALTRVTELVPGDAAARRNREEVRRRAGLVRAALR
jgi:4-amino-4-deoxy-L-arabinose transferase-like glycosyltransferase